MFRHALACTVLLLLGACSRDPAPPPAASAPAATSASTAPATAVAAAPAAEPPVGPPDCSMLAPEVATLVCGDAGLGARHARLLALVQRVTRADPARSRRLAAWAQGRDACVRDAAPVDCAREAYDVALVEAQLDAGHVVAVPVQLRCGDDAQPLTATFVNDITPRAAVIRRGDAQWILFPQDAASGARYGRRGAEYWEHQGEATLDLDGLRLRCRILA